MYTVMIQSQCGVLWPVKDFESEEEAREFIEQYTLAYAIVVKGGTS